MQDMLSSVLGDLYVNNAIQAPCVQTVEAGVRELVAAIRSCFSVKRLALIIDDVWDVHELAKLDLALDCGSSMLVTSGEALSSDFQEPLVYAQFQITAESNRAQQEAILASFVAKDPGVETVKPHLKVPFLHMCYCHHAAGQGYRTSCRGAHGFEAVVHNTKNTSTSLCVWSQCLLQLSRNAKHT
jgi:hypothetical protein